jgi:hypothetical protein
MTVFASVIDLLPALQHFRRVLRVCRTDRPGRGVMQTMSKSNPSLAVLIDQRFDLVRLELDALVVPFTRFRNVAARNLQKVRGLDQLKGTPANRGPLFGGVGRLLFLAFRGHRGRDGVPDCVGHMLICKACNSENLRRGPGKVFSAGAVKIGNPEVLVIDCRIISGLKGSSYDPAKSVSHFCIY